MLISVKVTGDSLGPEHFKRHGAMDGAMRDCRINLEINLDHPLPARR
jgi:hypothetical protein